MAFHPGKMRPNSETVSASTQLAFALLKPGNHPARKTKQWKINDHTFLENLQPNSVVALDLETKGTDPCAPDTRIVGIGLASTQGSVYYTADNLRAVFQILWQSQVPLIAHNMFFDASWLIRDFPDRDLNWLGCTYAWYKLMATEGWPGQEWGLKAAQKQLLGWTETNETELDLWLVRTGHIGGWSLEPKEGYYQTVNAAGEMRYARPEKGAMWQAPEEVLGRYCALDAESTWLLYTHILAPVLREFPALAEYAGPMYAQYILLLVQQKLRGILVDKAGMENQRTQLKSRISQTEAAFLSHPLVSPHVAVYNQAQSLEHSAKEPPQFLKSPTLGEEPPALSKKGKPSKAHAKWLARKEAIANTPPVTSPRWLAWKAKLLELQSTNHFNMNSGPQRQWLFYTQMEYPILFTTESGQPATDDKALRAFGEPGKLLIQHNEYVKELGYVEQFLGLLREGPEGHTLHAGWRVPGTLTGRLAGKEPNLQQVPKTVGFLKNFVARPGHVWIDCDHVAVEQVVLAELSKDAALWKLYGPGAPANDVYLYTGANLPGIGEAIRAAGYSPESPTPEGIASAKKLCKKERSIAKIVQLASSYGAGPGKIAQTLSVEGIHLSEQEAVSIHRSYWDLYAGVKKYERFLQNEYRNRRGWILNGIGRPIGVAADYTKDLVNRCVQSTSHDAHILYINIWTRLLSEAGIPYSPIVADFHDQSIVEVPEEHAEAAKNILGTTAYSVLNSILGGCIPLRGDAQIVHNLAEAKCDSAEIQAYNDKN